MKRRANPLPKVLRSSKGTSIASTTIMRENESAPLGLRMFLGVVLGRMAMHYTSTSIVAQDALEEAFNRIEARAVGVDVPNAELYEIHGYAVKIMDELSIKGGDEESFSLWAIVRFACGLAAGPDLMGASAMLRHAQRLVDSYPKRSNDVRYAVDEPKRPQRAIAYISRGILERKSFPRELLIGLDSERTNAVLYEALLRRKR